MIMNLSDFIIKDHVFSDFELAYLKSKEYLTFDQLIEKYRDLSIAQKQQFNVIKHMIYGTHDTLLFTRYQFVKKES